MTSSLYTRHAPAHSRLPSRSDRASGSLARRPAGQPHGRIARAGLPLHALLALLPLGLAACSGTGGGPPSPPELTSDGLQMVRSTSRSRLWVKPDHHIGRYDDILVTGIGFAYGRGQDALSREQENQVGQMLKSSISKITERGPVGQATEAGPCVVSLQLGLKDIYLHIGKTSGSSVSFVSSFGSATMVVEFRDSLTDVPLLRYAANRGLGGGPGTGRMGANLGLLGWALGEMVTDMTTELRKIVPDTTVRSETECNNGIYKLTGRG